MPRQPAIDYKIKLIIVGNSEVGKTSLVANYLKDTIVKTYIPTVEKKISTHQLELQQKNIQVQLWDFSGADNYRTITAAQYSGAQGALIVYSRTDIESFLHVGDWKTSLLTYHQRHTHDPKESLKIVVVGTKSDSPKVCVSKENSDSGIEELGCKHFVGSAFQANSFEGAFTEIFTQILDEERRKEKEKALKESLSEDDVTKPLLGNKQEKRICLCDQCILL